MKKQKIIIAVPRGRIIEECRTILNKTNFSPDPLLFDDSCRRLTFNSSNKNIDFIKVRAFDVCTFVAFGAAQLGIAGDDVVQEFEYSEVYAPINLNVGHCRLSVAALESLLENEDPTSWSNIRIATKYPNLAKKHFAAKGIQVEAIKLNGSIELAPTLDMCRRIVDLVSTGKTLKENGLKEVEKIMDIQCKLIVNRSAYKTKTREIESIISSFKSCIL
jgi:ATP phosphoribosyltransferase